jgi:hypothetical protein
VALNAGVEVALGGATVAVPVLVGVRVAVEVAVLVVDAVSVEGAKVDVSMVAVGVSDGAAVGELGAEVTVLVGVDVDPLPREFFFAGVAVAWEVAISGATVAAGEFVEAAVGVLGCEVARPFLG